MSKQKPTIPKGTRDFGPEQMARRNYIFSIIKETFEKFGFQPLETPAMENLSVLTGKYGDEGDKLLFKILNSGDFMKTADMQSNPDYVKLIPQISEKGLRYDLTVPFARYVVMNQNDITFPFRRYQIQPVWRADRPQKGRYREFYQCDADVVGTDSLLCEAENVLMINEVFARLGIEKFTIKINNRKILSGITEVIGAKGKETAFCVAIDKLDKIGKEKVEEELAQNGFSQESIAKAEPFFALDGDNDQVVAQLKKVLSGSEMGMKGIGEVEEIFSYLRDFEIAQPNLKIDITLARGLTYYTGAIFEVVAHDSSITSSISGGGRYDDLTGVFGLEGVSGVGFSFGIERIFDIMEERSLFPQENLAGTKVLLVNFDEQSGRYALKLLKKLRDAGVASEVFPEPAKMKKQMNYADKKKIPYVLLAGSREIESQRFGLKNMTTGEQRDLGIDEIISSLK